MFKKTAIISLITLLITLLFLTSGVFPAAMAGERTNHTLYEEPAYDFTTAFTLSVF